MTKGFVWKCACGRVMYEEMPEDCPSCLRVGKFKRVPEDQIEEAMEGEVLSMRSEEDEDSDEEEL